MHQERIYILLSRKLSGEATETELAEFEQLLALHPELKTTAKQIIGFWQRRAGSDGEFLEATYLLHLERMKAKGIQILSAEVSDVHIESSGLSGKRGSLLKKRTLFALLATFIIAAGIWIFFGQNEKPAPVADSGNNQVLTRNGSRTKIQLQDGSIVWLNAGSQLEYGKSFGNNTREVHLHGEAFFDVVKNPEIPFIVKTNAARIKVLGTAFNVRSYPDDSKIETSLIRGSVEITLNKRPAEKWVLKPNEKLVLLNEYTDPAPLKTNEVILKRQAREPIVAIKKLTYRPGETIAVEAAWINNKLSFEDEPFFEVAQKMERWYDVKFVFRNNAHHDLMLYGSFTSETIGQAMEALQYSFKFRYEIKEKEVIIY